MNDAAVRELAQSDPTPTLTGRWGVVVSEARCAVERLTATLRELDKLQTDLEARKIDVSVDLGPIGNAAAAARRDLERQKDKPTFELPRS